MDPQRAGTLLQLVGRFCAIGPVDWAFSGEPAPKGPSIGETEGAAAALRDVIAGQSQSANAWYSGNPATGPRIAVGYGPPLYRHWLYVAITAPLPDTQHEPCFVALCELLLPRHARYLPNFQDAEGDQGAILEMALQKDFRMYGFESDSGDVIRARSIAPLFPRMPFAMPDPAGLPGRLGWLNYWHPEAAVALGFPDTEKDAAWLRWSSTTPSGAWLVKLTDEPLDLARPDHVDSLAQAYWRFDKVGNRMRPAAPKAKAAPKRAEADTVPADRLKWFVVRERDANGNWWASATGPIQAPSADEALRIYFARSAHGRAPRRGDTLDKLRGAYDALAVEVGLAMSADIEVAESPAQ
jgi:hypothetical protein